MPRGHVFPDFHWIAHLRGEAGLTQDDLAVRSGFGRRTISKIENGKPTTAPTLKAIAVVLARSLGRIVTLADLVNPPGGQANRHGAVARPAEFVVAQQILSLHLPSLAIGNGRRPAAEESDDGDESHEPEPNGHANGSSHGPHAPNGTTKRWIKEPRSTAVLIDTYSLRFFEVGLSEIAFSYLSLGSSMLGRSLSHPDAGRKRGRRNTPAVSQCHCGADDPAVRVMISHFPDRPLVVQNEIEYGGAFQQPGEQRFVAEVAYPTESLAMLIHFSGDRRFSTLLGRCQRRLSDPWSPVAEEPISLSPNRVAYWRIENPTVGERYELSWQ